MWCCQCFHQGGDCEIMCDVQHWLVLSKTLIWILWMIWILVWWLVSYIGLNTLLVVCDPLASCVKIWRELCGTYPESSRGLVLVLVICCVHFQVLPELEERGRWQDRGTKLGRSWGLGIKVMRGVRAKEQWKWRLRWSGRAPVCRTWLVPEMYGTEDDTRHVSRGLRFWRRHEVRGVARKNMRMKNGGRLSPG